MLNIRSGFCVPSYPHIVNVLSLVFELANLGSAWKGHWLGLTACNPRLDEDKNCTAWGRYMESKGENLGEAPVVPTGWTVLLRAVLQVAARDSLADYTITIAHNLGRSFSGYATFVQYVCIFTFSIVCICERCLPFLWCACWSPLSLFALSEALWSVGKLWKSWGECPICQVRRLHFLCGFGKNLGIIYMDVFLGCIYGGTKVVPKWGIWWDLAQNHGRFAAIKHKCLRLAFLFLVPWAIKRLGNDNEQY